MYIKYLSLKKKTTNEVLCKNLPSEFCDYIKYVKSLKFQEEPNYLCNKKNIYIFIFNLKIFFVLIKI